MNPPWRKYSFVPSSDFLWKWVSFFLPYFKRAIKVMWDAHSDIVSDLNTEYVSRTSETPHQPVSDVGQKSSWLLPRLRCNVKIWGFHLISRGCSIRVYVILSQSNSHSMKPCHVCTKDPIRGMSQRKQGMKSCIVCLVSDREGSSSRKSIGLLVECSCSVVIIRITCSRLVWLRKLFWTNGARPYKVDL